MNVTKILSTDSRPGENARSPSTGEPLLNHVSGAGASGVPGRSRGMEGGVEHSGEACVGSDEAWEAYRAALTPAGDCVGPDRGGRKSSLLRPRFLAPAGGVVWKGLRRPCFLPRLVVHKGEFRVCKL